MGYMMMEADKPRVGCCYTDGLHDDGSRQAKSRVLLQMSYMMMEADKPRIECCYRWAT